jgi:hypothetical protein
MDMTQRLPEASHPVPENPLCRESRASGDSRASPNPRALTRIRFGRLEACTQDGWIVLRPVTGRPGC